MSGKIKCGNDACGGVFVLIGQPLCQDSLGGVWNSDPLGLGVVAVEAANEAVHKAHSPPCANVLVGMNHIEGSLGAATDFLALQLFDDGHDAQHGLAHWGAAVNLLAPEVQDNQLDTNVLNPVHCFEKVAEGAPQTVVAGDHQHIAALHLAGDEGARGAFQKLGFAADCCIGTPLVGSVLWPAAVTISRVQDGLLGLQGESLFVSGSATVPEYLHGLFPGVA